MASSRSQHTRNILFYRFIQSDIYGRESAVVCSLSSVYTYLSTHVTRIVTYCFRSLSFVKYFYFYNVLLANVNSRSRSLYAIARPSVCLSSVTFVRPTQAVQIFGNISTALGTVAIR